MNIQVLKNIFAILIWMTPLLSSAQLNTSQAQIPSSEKSLWAAKIEVGAKSTYDKANSIDGYTSDADFQIYRMFSPGWGAILGSVIAYENREDKPTMTTLELASMGILRISSFAGLKWKSQLTYNFFLQSEMREQKSSEGYALMDLRTYAPLGLWGRTRLRLKHYEFLPFSDKASVLIRQTKLEYSPAVLNGPLEIGLKNHWTHFWQMQQELDTCELAPFIKYNGDIWEPLFKIGYRPLEKSQHFAAATDWEQRPYYSVELEMNF